MCAPDPAADLERDEAAQPPSPGSGWRQARLEVGDPTDGARRVRRRCLIVAAALVTSCAPVALQREGGELMSANAAEAGSTTTVTVARRFPARRVSRSRRVRLSAPTPADRSDAAWAAIKERIARCESGGSYTARNRHSTASGKYQELDSTFAMYKGFARAWLAPADVQEEHALLLYRRAGLAPWAASRHCWGHA